MIEYNATAPRGGLGAVSKKGGEEMIVRMNMEIREAKIEGGEGYYILSKEWKVFQGDNIISLEYENKSILKITSEGEVFYNPSPSEILLRKENNVIKLQEITIRFVGFDIAVELNGELAVEFQGFLESGFAIDLS